ncbi:DNA helicase, DnaB-like, C-terminal [Artemisia annua]|uniref:DNA helicase, DnaB-like, C-terminal n=1 Tax=Artemisia annua TaxID=35608 RepID=A0A2U1PNB2_ARTAN|nr:DNA helicase, DnaB-like, C-terminal [Artemisia annua]
MQLQQWTGKPPNLYDISGSAHFIKKCDNGIVVHRNRDPEERAMDQVQVGNAYVQFMEEENAAKALKNLTGRYYAGEYMLQQWLFQLHDFN